MFFSVRNLCLRALLQNLIYFNQMNGLAVPGETRHISAVGYSCATLTVRMFNPSYSGA